MLQLINFIFIFYHRVLLSCQQSMCRSRWHRGSFWKGAALRGEMWNTNTDIYIHRQTRTICLYFQHLSPQLNLLGQFDGCGIWSCTPTQRHDSNHAKLLLTHDRCYCKLREAPHTHTHHFIQFPTHMLPNV